MKGIGLFSFVCMSALSCMGAESLSSPDGKVVLDFNLAEGGKPEYSVSFDGEEIVRRSGMGFVLNDEVSFADGFSLSGVERGSLDEVWHPVWGENSGIRNHYNELTVHLSGNDGRLLDIVFRAYDDGAAFRYVFPEQDMKELVIADEVSEMAMGGDYTAWWIPGDYDTQEYVYRKSRLSDIRGLSSEEKMANLSQSSFSPTGVQTSLLLRTDSGKYINLHEAALVDFPAMHLNLDDENMVFTSWLTPSPDGSKAIVETPFRSPWRVIMVGDEATDILASDLIYNLNDPCVLEDTSWIEPVKYMGVWWEMITGKSSWSYTDVEDFDLATFDYSKAVPNGRHGANNENVKRYIDFAADNGMDQLLIEGWNVGWEDWFGKEKDFVFDFVTPYPDFDLDSLNAYAHEKGIRLMMHHETSGSIPNYERHLDCAYDLMNRYGYNAVKSGYVGNILPMGENHYSQRSVKHYLDAVKKAADKKIMVNAHEAVRPTGLARTYPNLIGNESAMGTEYQNMPPAHVTVLPFTRLKGGPMDFTPGILHTDLSFAPGNTQHKRATTANQLALYVTMYSPLQMAADLPEHYAEKPDAFEFIKDVPVDWSESRYLSAEPGEYIVVARKDKKSEDWYLGGVAAENGKAMDVVFDFLSPDAEYEATVYADAPDAHCDTNPEAYQIYKVRVKKDDSMALLMAPGGGVAISLKRL